MDFRKKVKKRLIDLDKNQKWLEEQVRDKTGLFVDSGYLSNILSGQRSSPKIVSAIREILDIKEE